ncbi:MAG TPA: copper resistance protein CopC [Acidimicrobiales bacterium]
MRRAWARGAAWLAAGVGVVALVVGGGASPAAAHAELLETQPAAGAQLDTAPEQVVLRYSETVDPSDDAIEVFDADGDRVETGDPHHPTGEPKLVAVDLPPLEDGAYVVTWKVVSEDSHPIRGAYTFRVGAGAAGDADAAAAEALKDELVSAEGGDDTVGFLFGVVRFVAFVGLVLLVGGALFLAAVWPGGLGDPRARRLLAAGWAAAVAATLLSFGFQGAYSEGTGLGTVVDTGPIGDVLSTRPGRMWLLRLGLLVLVAVAGAVATRRASTAGGQGRVGPVPGALAAVAAVGLGLFATVSFAGHAGAGDYVGLAIVTDLVHLGAVAFWLGGLALLFVAVLRAQPSPPGATATPAPVPTSTVGAAGVATPEVAGAVGADGEGDPAGDRVTAAVVDRFSTLAFAAVVAIVVSGTVQGWRQLRSVDALVDSTYGRVLLVKVLLFAGMLAGAAVSRRWVQRRRSAAAVVTARPGADGGDGAPPDDAATESTEATSTPTSTSAPATAAPPLRALRRSVGLEAGVAAGVLAVTALLVTTVPGKDDVAPLFATELHGSTVMVQVEVEPAVAGVVDVRLATLSHGGEPVDPPAVEASLSLPERDLPPIPLALEPTGTGTYEAADADLPYPGTWQLSVDVRLSDFEQDVLTGQIPIK